VTATQDRTGHEPGHAGAGPARGVVYLVGAGPGDPGLVTVRCLGLVATAEVLAYDRLIPSGLVDLAPRGCELVDVGKHPGRARLPQAGINRLLVERARAGRRVVRLKGGDPFVFGRGGEEAEACAEAGVRFEVVPGVTSATAGPAAVGVPLTHPELAAAFAVVTGHEQPGKPGGGVDWEALAGVGTLCVLMTVANLGRVAGRLLAAGRSPATPAVLVERATMPGQRVLRSTLGEVAGDAAAAGVSAPAMLVVGEVAALAGRIGRPGRRLPAPPVSPGPHALDRAVAALAAGTYHWTVLTSHDGVEALRGRVEAAGLDARALAATRVAATGPAAVAALRAWGIVPDLTLEVATGAALAAFPSPPPGPDAHGGAGVPGVAGPAPRVLLPGGLSGPEPAATLRGKGWAVEVPDRA